MYFDSQLWALTRGIRWRFCVCAVFGLLTLGTGIARFAFLGQFLSRMFAGAPMADLWLPLGGVALAVVLRAVFEHALNCLSNRNASRIQENLRARLYDKIVELRSEEHTSELQSLMRISYAVFCLKKKKTSTIMNASVTTS